MQIPVFKPGFSWYENGHELHYHCRRQTEYGPDPVLVPSDPDPAENSGSDYRR
jgi:hypothetical protein